MGNRGISRLSRASVPSFFSAKVQELRFLPLFNQDIDSTDGSALIIASDESTV